MTPAQQHAVQDKILLANRHQVYQNAKQKNRNGGLEIQEIGLGQLRLISIRIARLNLKNVKVNWLHKSRKYLNYLDNYRTQDGHVAAGSSFEHVATACDINRASHALVEQFIVGTKQVRP